jgi:YidC/Oxa1 family membrane protein insertase
MTLLLKLLLYPLTSASYRSMAKMRKFTPKIQELRELYGDDRARMSQETMKLYQKEKLNPLGGCLPMLVQMPVFIALYWVLMESVELRQSPFMFWIVDLSIKDPFFVLPLLMGG